MIAYLRRYKTGLEPYPGSDKGDSLKDEAELLLIRLGDEQTIGEYFKGEEQYAQKFGEIPVSREGMATQAAQPLLVPHLAEKMFSEDGDKAIATKDDDLCWISYPVSMASSLEALNVMEASSVFSASVQEWARVTYEQITHEYLNDRKRQLEIDRPPWLRRVVILSSFGS